jgi:pimeloyl-ACP methyl ester carboxylesterase
MTELRSGSFESLVSRPDTHAVLDLDGAGRTLLVLFGGIAGGVSMPVFEFFRLTSSMPGKKAFLRDPRRAWYQLGIPGIGDSADDVRSFLDSVIERAAVDRVVMAGASAGGFAALQFGTWCRADEVIAFSPQTFIDPENRSRFGDARWPEQIDALHNAATSRSVTFDLLDVLGPLARERRFQVHVSTDDALDIIHANRISKFSGVEIVDHQHGGHRLVKTLRDRGLLRPILLRALAGDRTDDDPNLHQGQRILGGDSD